MDNDEKKEKMENALNEENVHTDENVSNINEINEESAPKKKNTIKIVGIAAILVAVITGGTVLAKNLLGSANAEALNVVTSTMEQLEKEYETFESTHKDNLTTALNEDANAFNTRLTFGDGGLLEIPEISVKGRTIDNKASYTLSVEEILAMDINIDENMSTLSVSENVYSIDNATFGKDLVDWLNDNGMPLDEETEKMLLDTTINVPSIEANEKIRKEYMSAIQKFMLKGKYKSLDDRSDDVKSYFQVSFSDEAVKDFILDCFDITSDDPSTLRIYSDIMESEELVTRDDLKKFLDEGKFKDFIITIGHIDNIISDVELFVDDHIETHKMNLIFKDTTKLINGFTFDYDNNGTSYTKVDFEGEFFDQGSLFGNINIELPADTVGIYYDYSFNGPESYDNGILKVVSGVGDYSFTSSMTSVNSEFYFDITLPSDYEAVLGKGKIITTINTDNTNIDLNNVTSKLFDNSLNEIMANETETVEKITNFIQALSYLG